MKICFWGDIASALNGKTSGGGQLQIALLAKALSNLGHEVTVIDYETDHEFETSEGIKVIPVVGWNDGIKMIRTFTHKLPGLYSTLKGQKADIYYCRIRNYRHILAYLASRNVKGKFILGLASDLDIMNFRSRWKYLYTQNRKKLWFIFDGIVTEFVFPFLLRKSDLIFVQHAGQKEILNKKGIASVVFHNLIDLSEVPSQTNSSGKDFVYVGRLDIRKGFAEFFDLVRQTPQYNYKVIGPPRHEAGLLFYEKFKSLPNVTLLGELNHSDTLEEMANSKALISTSPMEGFPNIFIEAWACGIPVLSLYVDPGGVIKKEKLGEIAYGNLEVFIQAMENIENNDDFANRARAYVEANHVLNNDRLGKINALFYKIQNDSFDISSTD